jgi:hypothetical protein
MVRAVGGLRTNTYDCNAGNRQRGEQTPPPKVNDGHVVVLAARYHFLFFATRRGFGFLKFIGFIRFNKISDHKSSNGGQHIFSGVLEQ